MLNRAMEVAERAGRDDWSGPNLATVAIQLHYSEGDLTAARAAAAAGRRRSPGQVGPAKYRWLDVEEARVALSAGDVARAAELVEGLSPVGPGTELEAWYHGLRAQVAAARGDPAQALVEIGRAVAAPDPEAGYEAMVVALRAGAEASKVRELAAAVTDAQCDDKVDPGWLDQVEGALCESEDAPGAALEAYDRAIDHPVRRPAPRLAACHLGAARCLTALGRVDEAVARAREADRLLGGWPGPLRDEARRLMGDRRDGAPAARTDKVPVGAAALLTPREREVAALLAEGPTNAELARRLYISTKTAAVHVSNILTKLGMSSRAEVAAWAVAVGLATPLKP
jgi:DNA-binding CsgD family transcriptional regulator